MSYKVVIPSAGLGSRIGPHTKFLNKALVTIGDKPAISRVIEKFPSDIPIVVLLGYKGDMVREVLTQLYPNRSIEFIDVDLFEGEGSGLGYSLSKAESHLQCSFIFIPNDTIIGADQIDIDPSYHGNWACYYRKQESDQYSSEVFRTLELSDNEREVVGITGKGTLNSNIYIGVCGVKDYSEFWSAMKSKEAVSVGEVFGLKALNQVKPIRISDWYDCGSLQYLELAKEKFKSGEHNILEKQDEAIWFLGKDVIKFSVNENFISDRKNRLQYLPGTLLPKIIKAGRYTYKYLKVEGQVIAGTLTPDKLSNLLDVCNESMWSERVEVTEHAKSLCYEFYRDKTYSRLDHYLNRFEQYDDAKILNGVNVESAKALLGKVDWQELCETPHWSLFHGDFHGENIISSKTGGFALLDWRQCFGADSKKYGDAYYDLAKFRHGLLVNHGIVNTNGFVISELAHNYVFVSIKQHSNLVECEAALERWMLVNGFDAGKVKLLTALIYLNICGLHEYPYAKFLYLYGQHLLNDYLTGE
jgi:CTP:phosphocholine cytidylyltransferase-like protein